MTEGSSWGSNTSDCVEEPESQTEAQPVVLGRGTATQHSQHTSRYFPVLYESYLSLLCKYLFLPFHGSIILSCLHSILFSDSPALYCICWLTPNSASPSLSLIIILSLSLSLISWISSLVCFSAIVFCPRGPGFVESSYLYPLDLAGLEHMQSAFSFYRRYGMTSQCEYYGTLSLSQPVLDNWL